MHRSICNTLALFVGDWRIACKMLRCFDLRVYQQHFSVSGLRWKEQLLFPMFHMYPVFILMADYRKFLTFSIKLFRRVIWFLKIIKGRSACLSALDLIVCSCFFVCVFKHCTIICAHHLFHLYVYGDKCTGILPD